MFGAAGVGNDAEAAELVAAFLDGQERGDALGRGAVRQVVELVLRREVGLDHLAAGAGRAGDHFRQAMIGLRAEDDVDIGRAGEDFRALGLGDAAGDGEDHAVAGGFLHPAQAAEFGEHLLGRLVADVAGVEDHHVGAVGFRYRDVAQRRQDVGHPAAVVHVHLAAPGDDVQTFAFSFGHRGGSARPCRTVPARGAGGMIGQNGGVKRDSADLPPSMERVWQ